MKTPLKTLLGKPCPQFTHYECSFLLRRFDCPLGKGGVLVYVDINVSHAHMEELEPKDLAMGSCLGIWIKINNLVKEGPKNAGTEKTLLGKKKCDDSVCCFNISWMPKYIYAWFR